MTKGLDEIYDEWRENDTFMAKVQMPLKSKYG